MGARAVSSGTRSRARELEREGLRERQKNREIKRERQRKRDIKQRGAKRPRQRDKTKMQEGDTQTDAWCERRRG